MQRGTGNEKIAPPRAFSLNQRYECILSGPHPEAVGTRFKYMRVAVFSTGPKNNNLPCVRGLTLESSKDVGGTMQSVLGELSSIMGEHVVVRMHTDAGGSL